jgi:hypothetical protein
VSCFKRSQGLTPPLPKGNIIKEKCFFYSIIPASGAGASHGGGAVQPKFGDTPPLVEDPIFV